MQHNVAFYKLPPPPPPPKKATYNSESFCVGWAVLVTCGRQLFLEIYYLLIRVIGRDFGSLVYYGVAKIILSWAWHRLRVSGSQWHISIQILLKSPLPPLPPLKGHSCISKWPLYYSHIDHTKIFLILSLTLLLPKPDRYLISPSDNNAKSRRKVQKLFLNNYYYYQWKFSCLALTITSN